MQSVGNLPWTERCGEGRKGWRQKGEKGRDGDDKCERERGRVGEIERKRENSGRKRNIESEKEGEATEEMEKKER